MKRCVQCEESDKACKGKDGVQNDRLLKQMHFLRRIHRVEYISVGDDMPNACKTKVTNIRCHRRGSNPALLISLQSLGF